MRHLERQKIPGLMIALAFIPSAALGQQLRADKVPPIVRQACEAKFSGVKVIKTIDVGGRPDGILFDPYNERVWVLSHQAPYATVIDAKEGTVVGTLDLQGAPEQAVSDGKGTIYVNISDKANIDLTLRNPGRRHISPPISSITTPACGA